MFNKILLFLLGGKGWKGSWVTKLALGNTAPTRTVPGFRGPSRGPTDLGIQGSEAGPKTIPGGGPGAALEPRDAVPPSSDARAAGHSPCSPRRTSETRARSLAAKSVQRPPRRSKTRRASARRMGQLEPIKGQAARVPERLRLRALRSARRCYATALPSAPLSRQAPPRRPGSLQTAGNLVPAIESGECMAPPPWGAPGSS